MVVSGELILSQKSLSEHRSRKQYTIYKLHHFLHKNATQEKKTNKKMVSMMSTTSAFISSPTTLKLRKKSNTNKRSNNSLLSSESDFGRRRDRSGERDDKRCAIRGGTKYDEFFFLKGEFE